jgi:hypothetical protein
MLARAIARNASPIKTRQYSPLLRARYLYGPQSVDPTPEDSFDSLLKLAELRLYAAVERKHHHLVGLGIPIKPHPLYEHVALSKLRYGINDLDGFEEWLRLTPDIANSSQWLRQKPYETSIRLIIDSYTPYDRVDIIHRLASVLAEKGYEETLFRRVLPTAGRIYHPKSGAKFMLGLENSLLAYAEQHSPPNLYRDETRLRNELLKQFCAARWFTQAIELLNRSKHIFIHSRTFKFMLKKFDTKEQRERVLYVMKRRNIHLPSATISGIINANQSIRRIHVAPHLIVT